MIKPDILIKVPRSTYGRITPCSGLTMKHLIDVAAGVVNSAYRVNVGIVLFNHSFKIFHVEIGDRIAQLILEIESAEVKEFSDTEEGENGFG